MIMIFYRPKTWEEFINLRNHKFKMRLVNKQYIDLFYHPDNLNYIKALGVFKNHKFN